MDNTYNVLIVEDHQFVANAYKNILRSIESTTAYTFNIEMTFDSDSAFISIEESKKNDGFDLAILDMRLPVSKEGKPFSGEDIGLKLKECFQHIKLIFITAYSNNYILYNILKRNSPHGLLTKSDVTNDNLTEAIVSVINDIPFYSKKIKTFVRKHLSNEYDIDEYDRQILYYLSLGIKTKNLCKYICLSTPGILKRKKALKLKFNLEKNDDLSLILKAGEFGII